MADRSETLKLIISGEGKELRTALGRSGQDVRRWGGQVGRTIGLVHSKITAGLKRMVVNPVSGLIAGGGLLMAGKQIVDFEDKIASLRVQKELDEKQTLETRNAIIQAANDSLQSWDDTVDAFNEIINKTGDLNLAVTGIRSIGVASKATASDIMDITSVTNALNINMGIMGDQIMDAFGILASQGKNGSFIFSELASQSERLFSAASILNLKGVDDLRKYGAFLQMIRTSFGSPEEAATMVKNIMVRIKTQSKKIEKDLGFKVFDSEGSLKEFDTIIKELVTRSKGDVTKLYPIFQESAVAFTRLINEQQDGKGFNTFDSFLKTSGSDQLWEDFSIKADTAKAKLQLLSNVVRRFSDKALSNTIQNLTDKMNEMMKDPEKMKAFQDQLDQIAESISRIGTAAVNISPTLELVGALAEGMFGSDRIDKTRAAKKEFDALPKEVRRQLRPKISGSDWEHGVYNVMQQYKASLKNENQINLSVSIDRSGNVRSESKDLDTSIHTTVLNRGDHRAAQ